jgi:hypothetical protein
MQRSSKNANLYREIYGDYNNLDNLPIPDNTDEIDLQKLKKIMHQDEEELSKTREMKFAKLEQEVNKNEEPDSKIYDINKLLEYAKNENNKLKEQPINHENTSNYKLLQTLENKVLTKEEIFNSGSSNNEDSKENTSELKYQTKKISVNPSIDQIITSDSTSSLSLDILSDLKPNGDTGVTKPINDKEDVSIEDDVNIIKDDVEEEDKDSSTFYTDIYKFSKKDFDDDFLEDSPKNHYVLKVILLIIFIVLCCGAIFYFVSTYGLN